MMELVEISLVLLALLTVLLCGGVWIAIALMAVGWGGMQFVGGNIPAGPVLATTSRGNSAPWSLGARARAEGGGLGRFEVRGQKHARRPGACDADLGQQRLMVARRAAAVHLDGRD